MNLSLDQVTSKQIGMMQNALGLRYKKKPYRNYFYCSTDNDEWNDLVSKGFATKWRGWSEGKSYFHLTYEGAQLVYGKEISEAEYQEL